MYVGEGISPLFCYIYVTLQPILRHITFIIKCVRGGANEKGEEFTAIPHPTLCLILGTGNRPALCTVSFLHYFLSYSTSILILCNLILTICKSAQIKIFLFLPPMYPLIRYSHNQNIHSHQQYNISLSFVCWHEISLLPLLYSCRLLQADTLLLH